MAPATFQMSSLMREMQEIEGARIVPQQGLSYLFTSHNAYLPNLSVP